MVPPPGDSHDAERDARHRIRSDDAVGAEPVRAHTPTDPGGGIDYQRSSRGGY
jgi:hypothetical protein